MNPSANSDHRQVVQPRGYTDRAVSWVFGQPANTVIMVGILASVGYGAWYGVPAAIDQIQEGYNEIDLRHAVERRELREDLKIERTENRQVLKDLTEAIKDLGDK